MFEHQHAIGRGQRDRAPRPAFADHRRDHRHAQRQALLGRSRDRLGLPALLGLHPRKRARRIDQGYHRHIEAVGEPHQADRLAIALGLGHPEIMLEPRRGVVAFFMPDQHHPAAVDFGQPTDDRIVVGERAVPRKLEEIVGDPGDIIVEMRPLGMPRDLGLLPRGQLGIGIAQQLGRLGLELADLGVDIDVARLGGVAQRRDPPVEVGDRFFKIEIGVHWPRGLGCGGADVNDPRAGGGH